MRHEYFGTLSELLTGLLASQIDDKGLSPFAEYMVADAMNMSIFGTPFIKCFLLTSLRVA